MAPSFGWQFEAFPAPFEYHMTQISGETGAAIQHAGHGVVRVCKDTEGNEFGLWQSDPSAPAPTG